MKRFFQYSAMVLVCAAMACFMAYAGWALFCAGPDMNGAVAYAYAQPETEYVPGAAVPEATDVPEAQDSPGVQVRPEPLLRDGSRVMFIGNSLVQGLASACDDDGTDFLCRQGISLPSLVRMLDGFDPGPFDLFVIGMGSNELGLYSKEEFTALYGQVLDRLGGKTAVCLSVPPVCEEKSRYGSRVSGANIESENGWIEEMCGNRDGAVYLDCSGFFGGSLDPGWTGDGLHLSGYIYGEWYAWIMERLTDGQAGR